MPRRPVRPVLSLLLAAVVLLTGGPAPACVICSGGNVQSARTLRQEAAEAKMILYGTLQNPRLEASATDLHVLSVVKDDPFRAGRKVVEISRYLPVLDPKDPPKFLIFCDVYNGKLDPYRGLPVKSADLVDYLKGATALDPKDRTKALLYHFRYLDHADSAVADDAFLEFAKADDKEVGQVAKQLAPEKLRRLLQDPRTPETRLGLFAFLLGACGAAGDAELLRALIEAPTQRSVSALDGLLCGYIQLRAAGGWALAWQILRDEKRTFLERFAVLRTMRFYHGWKLDEVRREMLEGLGVALRQGDLADLAIEDLRRWQLWDLTGDVLAQFGKKSHDAPIVRRTIVRYALACPKPEATRFVAELRKQDPELVKDQEDALQFEKQK